MAGHGENLEVIEDLITIGSRFFSCELIPVNGSSLIRNRQMPIAKFDIYSSGRIA